MALLSLYSTQKSRHFMLRKTCKNRQLNGQLLLNRPLELNPLGDFSKAVIFSDSYKIVITCPGIKITWFWLNKKTTNLSMKEEEYFPVLLSVENKDYHKKRLIRRR